jgi:hypothetical protein
MNRKVFWGRFLVALKKIPAVQLSLKRYQKISQNPKTKKLTNNPRKVNPRKVGAGVAVKVNMMAVCVRLTDTHSSTVV